MTEIFRDSPNVELLQWLARGSLKQNLLRAIRLWVWLRTLYGEPRLNLDDTFSYAQWRNAFFTSTHPKDEAIPKLHDKNCNCAKTTAQWVFENENISPSDWRKSLITHTGIETKELEKILQKRLFGITRRSLQGDLEMLADLGWVVYKNQKYHRVSPFPLRPIINNDEANSTQLNFALNFLNQEDLVQIAQNHSEKINGIQRFFLKLDYVVPKSTIDLVEDWQHELKEIWRKTPVPPIQVTYNSASKTSTTTCIVYPVCIYYIQRAVYLCAYGESPDRQTEWYNFRLDRIQKMAPLTWKGAKIPSNLQQRYQKDSLPTPDIIAIEMSKAWGFDFYLPEQLMLLRFDRDFHDRYVKGTERHDTFEEITYQQAQRLLKKELKKTQQLYTLQKILANRDPEDAYYQVYIRYQDTKHRDNNVIMRLRAWRPKCEVLLPWDLREDIADDVATEFFLYQAGNG